MPERENVPCRVDIAVVSDTTLTGPFSYSKPCDTSRPAVGQCAATATGLGGVCLADFPEDDSCVSAFVGQHRFQLAPAGIEHGLGHIGFDEFLRADIAHHNQIAAFDQRAAELVQGILAPVGNPGVDGPDAGFLAGALSNGQGRLQIPVEAGVFKHGPIATGGYGFEPQVDTHGVLPGRRLGLYIDHHIEIPATTGIFSEATRAETVLAQAEAVPDLEEVSVVVDLAILPARRAGIEWNPAQRTAHTTGLAPVEPALAKLQAPSGVLLTHRLNGMTV